MDAGFRKQLWLAKHPRISSSSGKPIACKEAAVRRSMSRMLAGAIAVERDLRKPAEGVTPSLPPRISYPCLSPSGLNRKPESKGVQGK